MGWEGPVFVLGFLAAAWGSLCESAFATYSHARIAEIIARLPEDRRAPAQKRLVSLLARAEDYLFASSLTRLAGGVLAAWAVANWFLAGRVEIGGDAVSAGAVAAGGAVMWLLGEIVPTAVGYGLGETILVRYGDLLAGTLLPARILVWPGIWLGRSIGGESGPLGTDAEKVIEEVRSILSQGQQAGAIEPHEGRMIQSIVDFQDRTVRDIMTPRTDVCFISSDASVDEAIRTVIDSGHTRLPAYEGSRDNVVGLVHAKDLLKIGDRSRKIKEVPGLLRKIHFVPASRRLQGLLEELGRQRVQLAVAVDEYGGTGGVVSVEDVVEEIVGEIHDEYDEETLPAIKTVDATTIEADGRVRIAEVNKALGCSLSEDQGYDTIAGFVLSVMGRIPSKGERIERDGVEVLVLSADARKIGRVRVRLLARETD